jgi:hypothetical protein
VDTNYRVAGLDFSGYRASVEQLQLIGGKTAVAALVKALDSSHFLPEHKAYGEMYTKEVVERNRVLGDALATMVMSPPRAKSPSESKKTWKEWWAKNKDTAKFVKPAATTYE